VLPCLPIMPGASAHTWVLSATSTLPQWGARGRPEAGLDGPLHGADRRPGVQRLRVDARASCMRARRLPGGRARARPRPARPLARGPPARRRRRVRAQAPCAPQLVPHARAPRATTRVERARMLQRGAPRTLLARTTRRCRAVKLRSTLAPLVFSSSWLAAAGRQVRTLRSAGQPRGGCA